MLRQRMSYSCSEKGTYIHNIVSVEYGMAAITKIVLCLYLFQLKITGKKQQLLFRVNVLNVGNWKDTCKRKVTTLSHYLNNLMMLT